MSSDYDSAWDWNILHSKRVETKQLEIKTRGALLKYMRGLITLSIWLDVIVGSEDTHHSWLVFDHPQDLYATLIVLGFRWSPNSRRWYHPYGKRPRNLKDLSKLKGLSRAPEWLQRYVREVTA